MQLFVFFFCVGSFFGVLLVTHRIVHTVQWQSVASLTMWICHNILYIVVCFEFDTKQSFEDTNFQLNRRNNHICLVTFHFSPIISSHFVDTRICIICCSFAFCSLSSPIYRLNSSEIDVFGYVCKIFAPKRRWKFYYHSM